MIVIPYVIPHRWKLRMTDIIAMAKRGIEHGKEEKET